MPWPKVQCDLDRRGRSRARRGRRRRSRRGWPTRTAAAPGRPRGSSRRAARRRASWSRGEALHRRHVAQQLLERRRPERRDRPRACAAGRGSGRAMTIALVIMFIVVFCDASCSSEQNPRDLGVGEVLALDLGVEDLRDEVVVPRLPRRSATRLSPVRVHLAVGLQRGRAGEVGRRRGCRGSTGGTSRARSAAGPSACTS